MNARDFDPQDPMWTAYLLGELSEERRAAAEQVLATSPAARQFLSELGDSIDQVTAALTSEAAPKLAPEQRAAVLTAIADPASATIEAALTNDKRRGPWRGRLVPALSLAALLLLTVGLARGVRWGQDGKSQQMVASAKQAASRERPRSAMPTEPKPGPAIEWFDAGSAPLDPVELKTETLSVEKLSSAAKQELADGVRSLATDDERHALGFRAQTAPTQPSPHDAKRPPGAPRATSASGSDLSGIQDQSGDRRLPAGVAELPPSMPLAQPVTPRIVVQEEAESLLDEAFRMPVNSPIADQGGGKGAGQASSRGRVGMIARKDEAYRPDAAGAESLQSTHDALPRSRSQSGALDATKASAAHDAWHYRPRQPDVAGLGDAEAYEAVTDNPFLSVKDNPLSTFSVDVDTASYANIRRFLTQNRQLPPPSAVRIEEMINYFPYRYAPPADDDSGIMKPFAVHTEVAGCPWSPQHRLLRIGIKGREIAFDQRPVSNLVFLLDVSGSMNEPNKLPLVKEAVRMLVGRLTENDRVAIVVYAGASGMVLPSVTGDQKDTILAALDRLAAGGSTNGGAGIELAYETAAKHFIKGGTNRVILATDGDFNVGVTDREALVRLVEDKAKSGVFLTALGFGMGNLKDATLEQLADKGNGAYAYIDGQREARKVFVEQMAGTLVTIAKDVKLQLEFNPALVASYRLIGYENRALRNEDFNNDKKDAGDIGAGHTVTALYELTPANLTGGGAVDPLKYQQPLALAAAAQSGELLTVKLRFKQPEGDQSQLIEQVVKDGGQPYGQASGDFKFASAVALFGMLLRGSPYHGQASFDAVLELAREGRDADRAIERANPKLANEIKGEPAAEPVDYRGEFLNLVEIAKSLSSR